MPDFSRLKYAAILPLLGFAVVFWMCVRGPLFTDEIHWMLQVAHSRFDGGKMVGLFAVCQSNFSWDIPWLMLPGREFASYLHPESLVGIRVYACLKFLGCVGLFAAIMREALGRVHSWMVCAGVSAALFSIGFLPVLFVFNRPETGILLGISVLVLAAQYRQALALGWWRRVVVAGWFFMLSWLLSLHPKAQSFFPVVLLLSWLMAVAFYERRGRIAFMGGVVVMMVSCVSLWAPHQQCPDAPSVITFLHNHTLVPQDFVTDPLGSLGKMAHNFTTMHYKYLMPFVLGPLFLGIYTLADMGVDRSWLEFAADVLALGVLGLVTAVIAVGGWRCVRREKMSGGLPASVGVLLLVPVLMVIATKLDFWSFWEAAFLFYMICLSAVLLVGRRQRGMRAMAAFIVMAGLVNQFTFYYDWHGMYTHMESSTEFPNGFLKGYGVMEQHFQGIFDESQRKERVAEVAQMCHIPLDNTAQHILFDETTYMSIHETREPYYSKFLFFNPPGNNESTVAFLKRTGSSGALTLCSTLAYSPELQSVAKQKYGLCCVQTLP